MLLILGIIIFGLPVYAFALLVPFEPIHRIFEDFLEINLVPNLRSFLIIIIVICPYLMFFAISAATLFAMGALYLQSCNSWILLTIPQEIHLCNRMNTKLQTKLGVLNQETICKIYRSQQIISGRINEILSSLWITAHHINALIVCCGMLLCLVMNIELVLKLGLTALVFPLGILGPIAIIYAETSTLDIVWTNSNIFLRKGTMIAWCKLPYFHKYIKSCRPIDVKTGDPFFIVRKEMFPLWLNQLFDFLVNFLVAQD